MRVVELQNGGDDLVLHRDVFEQHVGFEVRFDVVLGSGYFGFTIAACARRACLLADEVAKDAGEPLPEP